MGKGCKIALIIFGIILVLIIAAIIVSYIYCDRIGQAFMNRMMDAVEDQVLSDLPEGYDRDMVQQEFTDFREALLSGAFKDEGKANDIQRLGTEFQAAMTDSEIDGEELGRIINLMRKVSGKPPLELPPPADIDYDVEGEQMDSMEMPEDEAMGVEEQNTSGE
jgi:hypothetical protein